MRDFATEFERGRSTAMFHARQTILRRFGRRSLSSVQTGPASKQSASASAPSNAQQPVACQDFGRGKRKVFLFSQGSSAAFNVKEMRDKYDHTPQAGVSLEQRSCAKCAIRVFCRRRSCLQALLSRRRSIRPCCPCSSAHAPTAASHGTARCCTSCRATSRNRWRPITLRTPSGRSSIRSSAR